jgi:hypothetical protein
LRLLKCRIYFFIKRYDDTITEGNVVWEHLTSGALDNIESEIAILKMNFTIFFMKISSNIKNLLFQTFDQISIRLKKEELKIQEDESESDREK